jgi:hypothetical protein
VVYNHWNGTGNGMGNGLYADLITIYDRIKVN